MMTSKQRLRCALERRQPDRLPVTTHHLMDSFLRRYLGGASAREFFDRFGLDAIHWVVAHRPDEAAGEYYDPLQEAPGFLEARRVSTDHWRVYPEAIPGQEWPTTRFRVHTPGGVLSMVLQSNEHTAWVTEHFIKEKRDIDLLGEFMTAPKCDVEVVNREAQEFGERGIIRGHVCCFDVFGQPGTWQDAACLVGIERLILEAHDDPAWVHQLLQILQHRKLTYACSLQGAAFDVIEFGGGDASSTVISPRLFDEFVAPYDAPIIAALHQAGQRVVYHTCGGTTRAALSTGGRAKNQSPIINAQMLALAEDASQLPLARGYPKRGRRRGKSSQASRLAHSFVQLSRVNIHASRSGGDVFTAPPPPFRIPSC